MTIFQALIESFLHTLTIIIPLPLAVLETADAVILHGTGTNSETNTLVTVTAAVLFLYVFRYDWLGLMQAFIQSIVNPLRLNAKTRSLDQHNLLFFFPILLVSVLQKRFLSNFEPLSFLSHESLISGAICFVTAFAFYFSAGFNKRLHGLNHLRIVDGYLIALFSLLTIHHAFSIVAVLWIVLALRNYHYETIYKYSMLTIGFRLFLTHFEAFDSNLIQSTIESVGKLNSVSLIVVSGFTIWLGIEHLSKNLNENLFRSFQWLQIIFGLFLTATYFFGNS